MSEIITFKKYNKRFKKKLFQFVEHETTYPFLFGLCSLCQLYQGLDVCTEKPFISSPFNFYFKSFLLFNTSSFTDDGDDATKLMTNYILQLAGQRNGGISKALASSCFYCYDTSYR